MPIYFVLVPLAALLVLNLPIGSFGKKAAFPTAVALAAFQALAVILLPPSTFSGPSILFGAAGFSFAADALSLLLLLTIGIVSLASLGVGYGTCAKGDELARFSMLLILRLAGLPARSCPAPGPCPASSSSR